MTPSVSSLHIPGAFHEPASSAAPLPHGTAATTSASAAANPRVHPGLFRPPPQSHSPPPLPPATPTTTTATVSTSASSSIYLVRPPPFGCSSGGGAGFGTSTATKRKRGRDDSARHSHYFTSPSHYFQRHIPLGSDWASSAAAAAADPDRGYVLASPILGPVLTATPAYAGGGAGGAGMGHGVAGLGLGREGAGNAARGIRGLVAGELDDSVYSDVDYRRTGGGSQPRDHVDDPDPADHPSSPSFPPSPAPVFSSDPHAGSSENWTLFSLSTIGGVIGKVINFCTAGAFRGFYAGGGPAWEIGPNGEVRESEHGEVRESEHGGGGGDGGDDTNSMYAPQANLLHDHAYDHPHHVSAPLHADAHLSDNESDNSPSRPAAKRRQVSDSHDELQRNWVMVSEPERERERRDSISAAVASGSSRPASSSSRLNLNAGSRRMSMQSNLARRQHHLSHPKERASVAGGAAAFEQAPASFAPTRSPTRGDSPVPVTPSRIPVARHYGGNGGCGGAAAAVACNISAPRSRPSTSSATASSAIPNHRAATTPASAASAAATPLLLATPHFQRRSQGASAASPRRRDTHDFDAIDAVSPQLTPEAKFLAAQRAREEREADVRMSTLNARLLDMIRQGQEALGTSFEAEADTWMDDD